MLALGLRECQNRKAFHVGDHAAPAWGPMTKAFSTAGISLFDISMYISRGAKVLPMPAAQPWEPVAWWRGSWHAPVGE